jgi:hypothetical protein
MHKSGEKALQQTLNPTPLFPLLPLFFPNPEPSSTSPLNLTSLLTTKLGQKNRELSILPNPETLSLSLGLFSLPNFLLSTYRHYSHLLPNNARSGGGRWGGRRVSVKNPDVDARRKVETNEEDEQTRGEEARCATPATKPNTQVQKGKRNKGRVSERAVSQ